jgi:plasmid stabilization system protein ParE
MPSIVLRPKAMADLVEIWAYIDEDSIRQADAFAGRINQQFRMLARQPNLARGIEVVRVLHGARDLTPFFEQDID